MLTTYIITKFDANNFAKKTNETIVNLLSLNNSIQNYMKKITLLSILFILFLCSGLYAQSPNDDAVFNSQKVESVMQPGETYTASLSFKNSGKVTWKKGEYWIIYSDPRMNALSNNVWGKDSIKIKKSVKPGKSYEFKFTVTAPGEPGTYFFSWQICNKNGAFGTGSELKEIHVK